MEYRINKGAGRPIEFKGLKSQYLFIFAGGLVSVFLVVVILYMAGVSQWVCLTFGAFSGSLTVWMTFRLNARYGEHGLMKALAEKMPSPLPDCPPPDKKPINPPRRKMKK